MRAVEERKVRRRQGRTGGEVKVEDRLANERKKWSKKAFQFMLEFLKIKTRDSIETHPSQDLTENLTSNQ